LGKTIQLRKLIFAKHAWWSDLPGTIDANLRKGAVTSLHNTNSVTSITTSSNWNAVLFLLAIPRVDGNDLKKNYRGVDTFHHCQCWKTSHYGIAPMLHMTQQTK
jgi:hypothetical protein